jgi:hypothetical protein
VEHPPSVSIPDQPPAMMRLAIRAAMAMTVAWVFARMLSGMIDPSMMRSPGRRAPCSQR